MRKRVEKEREIREFLEREKEEENIGEELKLEDLAVTPKQPSASQLALQSLKKELEFDPSENSPPPKLPLPEDEISIISSRIESNRKPYYNSTVDILSSTRKHLHNDSLRIVESLKKTKIPKFSHLSKKG